MSINIDPLTDEEFDELDEFLLSPQCAADAMTMDVLHGFLTAIVIGPAPLSATEWLPHVWGAAPDAQPRFNSAEEQDRIMDLILRFMNEIAITFEVAPKEYEPLFCQHTENDKTYIDAEGWAVGFWEGIHLHPTAWQPLWSSPAASLLRPFYLLGADELEASEQVLINTLAKQHKLALEMEANILPLRRFWIEQALAARASDHPANPASPHSKRNMH